MNLTILSESAEFTENLGRKLAALLPPGTVVALYGDLATGKTCLVRGMAAHYGAQTGVHSPTFTLVNRYGTDSQLYHLDLYRLGGPAEVADLGAEELFEPEGVTAVEWAERAEGLLPTPRIEIHLRHRGENLREIVIMDGGLLPPEALAALAR